MQLLALSIQRFRNLAQVELRPSPHATVAVGPNGQGKTNLLEAIYFLLTLKPLRASRLAELVQFGQSSAVVSARMELGGAERTVAVHIENGARVASVDGKRAAALEDYFGGTSVVAFTPEDLEVIKGGPDGRRTFLDRAVFNRFPAYLSESRAYHRALKARNRLLKDRAEPAYLQAYDEAVAKAGARVWVRRRALISELGVRGTQAFDAIGRTPEPGTFGYEPHALKLPEGLSFAQADEAQLRQRLTERLAERLTRDSERGFTSVGPHADDLEVKLGEHSARSFASQGQQRALVLAWKVAEIENLKAHLGHQPLLLLDDVSSELDPDRNAYLMEYLAQCGAQTLLTTTEASFVRRAAGTDSRWFRVSAGQVTQDDSLARG